MVLGRLVFTVTLIAPLICAQSNGSISGIVTNSITGAAVEGVTVNAGGRRALTDGTGAFRIPGLPDGRYLMTFQKEGFTLSMSGVAMATVAASGDTRFDAKLAPQASLRGRVVDPEGKPAAGLTVKFAFKTAVTDDQGGFVIDKLNPITAPLWVKVKPQPDGKDGERLVPTYFPSAISAEQAVPLQVNGVDLSGYEIRLRTAPARTVRGVVLDADGKPRAHASVSLGKTVTQGLIPVIHGPFTPARLAPRSADWDSSETGLDGSFEFAAVLEGDWILRVFDLGNRQDGLTDLRVGRNDVDNVTLRLVKPFPIEVTPEWDNSESAESAPASASVMPLDGQVFMSTGGDAGPPFTAHLQGHPGRYLFAPGQFGSRGYYVSAVIVDGHDVLGQAVELDGPTAVKAILKNDGGSVRGTVEKGGGATVVLIADPTAYARFGMTARCDGEGNFTIADVPPGNYTAVAFQVADVLYLPPSDQLNRIDSARGERVKIEPSGSETVTLKVN